MESRSRLSGMKNFIVTGLSIQAVSETLPVTVRHRGVKW